MAATRARGRDGTARSVQAVLDLVGDPGDSMLAWTNHPWPYLDFHRVSATRFIWKSFLMGEIYLGRTDLSYVLPGSWDRWTEDVSRTQPVVALLDATFPIPADTPFAQLLATDFSMALSTPTLSLSLRRDVMAKLSDDSTSAAWSGDGGLGAGWSKDGVGLRYDGVDLDESAAILDLGDLRCSRFDATIIGDGVSFHVLDPTGSSEPVEALMAGGEAITRSPNVEFLRLPIARRGADRISFIVGNESAVLLVNGVVGGALTLLPSTLIQVTSTGDTAALGDVRVGPAPVGGEC